MGHTPARTEPAVITPATPPPSKDSTSLIEIAAHAESALRTVRLTIALMSCLVLAGLRPDSLQRSAVRVAGVAAIIVGSALLLNWISRNTSRVGWMVLSQVADTLAMLGLVVLLDEPLANQGWVLLIIPMVSATVRLGAIATLITWIASSTVFSTAAVAGIISGFEDRAQLIRIPGLLLAVAVCVSVLARWRREGWEIQNALTASAAQREERLAAIEVAVRSLHRVEPVEALEVCATTTLALGFDAATISGADGVEFAVGATALLPDRLPTPGNDGALTTIWTSEGQERVYSVAIVENQSQRIVTGWTMHQPNTDQARALASLVRHTSNAVKNAMTMASLQEASRHDALTGLLNRRGITDALAERSVNSLAAAFIDLDDLKAINDVHGHRSGDLAICAIANRLRAAAGSDALVGRFGGDEFVVVVPDQRLDAIAAVGRTLLDTTTQPVALGPLNIDVSVSIGVAVDEDVPANLERLLNRADAAVYEAKSLGKGTLVAWTHNGELQELGLRSATEIVHSQTS